MTYVNCSSCNASMHFSHINFEEFNKRFVEGDELIHCFKCFKQIKEELGQMKKMLIGKSGTVTKGVYKGLTGPIVAFDSQYDEVLIKVDEITCIQISSKYVDQSDNS